MVDAVSVKRKGKVIFDTQGGIHSSLAEKPVATEVELSIDQHFGIRIVQGTDWTTISFREAGEWSEPQDTRKVIRAAMMK